MTPPTPTDQGEQAAFPRIGEGFGNPYYDTPGMTIRQYYKAAALQGLLANPQIVSCAQLKSETHTHNIVYVASAFADLCLAEDLAHAKGKGP